MKVMILAAGRGTRLRPLTDATPKPLLQVGNYSLIEHLLFRLSANGFHDIVINVAHLGNLIIEKLQDGRQYGVSIMYSKEYVAGGLETGGGIFNALPLLGKNPFLVVSGDIWTDYPFSQLRNISLSGLVHLVLVDNPSDHTQGDFNLLSNKIVENQGLRLTYGNIGLYHPDLFINCTPGFFPLGPLLKKAALDNAVTGEHYQGTWVNVGTRETLEELRKKVDVTSFC